MSKRSRDDNNKMSKSSKDDNKYTIDIDDQIKKHCSLERYQVNPYYLTNPDANATQKSIQIRPKVVYSLEEAIKLRDQIIELRENDPNNKDRSKKRVDERKETYYPGETDMVTLLPCSTITTCQHRRTLLNWYEGSKYVTLCVDGWSKEEIDAKKKSINENLCNKITDAITIPRSHIDETHVRHYRYKQKFIDYPEQSIPIDPYFLGLWLGDGHSRNVSLTTIDKVIKNWWCEYAESNGMRVSINKIEPRRSEIREGEYDYVASYRIAYIKGSGSSNILLDNLNDLNLIENKHIPKIFLENSKEVRCQLLAGIIDTDGWLEKKRYYILQKNNKLSDDIYQLASSLGFYTEVSEVTKSCIYKDKKREGIYKKLNINIDQLCEKIPTLLKRKTFGGTRFWFNRRIDTNGNPVRPDKNNWSEDAVEALKEFVRNQKSGSDAKRINWSEANDPLLEIFTSDALRKKYSEL